ncbi:MAG: Gfo/Idh/MocA family oxidoreductase [Bacteroidota bacterium]
MRILFIGYSNVIRRRILPYIYEIDHLDAVDIAKYYTQCDEIVEMFDLKGELFNSYEEALSKSKAKIAYISTVNSTHAYWAEQALNHGMHVIVDKPAFMSSKITMDLVGLAKTKNLAIAEATVYSFHPQIKRVLEIIKERQFIPKNLTVNFSFPPMSPDNFRYNKSLGGGAINDLGPYVVSVGRVFFNALPEKIVCSITGIDLKNEIETSFSVLAQYSNGRTMVGNFGFNSEYINRLNVIGECFYFELNRVFTPPGDQENEVIFKTNNRTDILKTEKSNCFINFIKDFIDSIRMNNHSINYSNLIDDAYAIELLKQNIIE